MVNCNSPPSRSQYNQDCWQQTSNSGGVRVVFEEASFVDLWFARGDLLSMSAADMKRAAHRVISTLLQEAEEGDTGEGERGPASTESGTRGFEGDDARVMSYAGCGAEGRGQRDGEDCAAVESELDRGGLDSVNGGACNASRRRDVANGASSTTRRREAPIITRSFFPAETVGVKPPRQGGGPSRPPSLAEVTAEVTADAAADAAAAESTTAAGVGTVLAYRARLRVCGVILHFRAKGLRPGAFFFLAAPPPPPPAPPGKGLAAVRPEVPRRRGPTSGACGLIGETEGNSAGATGAREERRVREESVDGGDARASPLWITDESAPLLRALRGQWAGEGSADGGSMPGANEGLVEGGKNGRGLKGALLGGNGSAAAAGAGARRVVEEEEEEGGGEGLGETKRSQEEPELTLWIMPSARVPLPSICCGVCGSSWEIDSFGRGYRSYHLAVANNASLVWYIRKRFSEFLALHAAMAKGGDGAGGAGGETPMNRLPKPPTRAFGMMGIFPERMERLRRGQLDVYMQDLLSIPEALTNKLVLSFLGLMSTSRHDLMSPPHPRNCVGQRQREKIPHPRRTPSSSSNSSPFSPLSSPADIGGHGNVGVAVVNEGGARKEEEVMRKVERVSALGQAARGGDVVLFRCKGLLSRLQRWVSRSDWDHVGVVVYLGHGCPLQLLESSQEGVRLYPLVERVRAYQEQGFASMVAFRRLNCPRPVEARARLEAFARLVEGKTYGIVLPFLPRGPKEHSPEVKKPSSSSSPSATPPTPNYATKGDIGSTARDGDLDNAGTTTPNIDTRKAMPPSYLCSQLVGAALSEMGVLKEGSGGADGDGGWLWALPGTFGQGGAVERRLGIGVSLGEEILVDGHEPEVAGAVLFGAALAQDKTPLSVGNGDDGRGTGDVVGGAGDGGFPH